MFSFYRHAGSYFSDIRQYQFSKRLGFQRVFRQTRYRCKRIHVAAGLLPVETSIAFLAQNNNNYVGKTTFLYSVVAHTDYDTKYAKQDAEGNGTIEVLRYVAASLHNNPFCSTMAADTTGLYSHERVAIQQFDFIGLIGLTVDAATVTFTVKDGFQRTNIQITRAR